MRRSSPEVESTVPKISADHFTMDNSAHELDLSPLTHLNMIELNGSWKVVGWAFADDVAPRDLCKYVILFEGGDEKMWCHASNYQLDKIAAKIKIDPSKVAKS